MRPRAVFAVLSGILTGFLFPGSAVWAQSVNEAAKESAEEISVLDTMIITGSTKQTTLLKTPGSITVLTAKDIRNSGQTKLAELLATIPGVVNQKSGSKTYFSIRGSRGTLSPGAAIYVDGRPINTGLYRYSKIDTIPLDNVIKVEVVKSPSPAVYGSNASRGVILITTRSGKDSDVPFSGDVSMEYGSWNSLSGTAMVSGSKKGVFYSLAGHGSSRDGYRGSDDEVKSVDGKLGYKFDGGSVDMVAGFNDSFTKYPTGLDLETAQNNPESPGYVKTVAASKKKKRPSYQYYVLPNETDEELANIGLNFNYDKNNWLANASLVYTKDEQNYQQKKDQNSPYLSDRENDYADDRNYDQLDFKINGGKTFGNENEGLFNTLTLGFDLTSSDFDQNRSYKFSVDPNDDTTWTKSMRTSKSKADIDAKQEFYALNVNNDFNWKKFRLLAGGRLNQVKYDLKNQEPASVSKEYKDDLDWNIAPSYSIIPTGNLFVSYSHSHYYLPLGHYKSAMEYDHPDAQAEDLQPEIYDTLETGFKHQLHKAFNYSLIYYHTTIEDKAVSFYDGTKFKGYRNAGTSVHRGIEIELDGRPTEWFGYRLGFTTIDAKWDKGLAKAYKTPGVGSTEIIDLSGKEVNYVPEYEYSLGFDFYLLRQSKYGSLTSSFDLRGFGEQYQDYNNNLKMSDANFVDLKLTWTHGRYELFVTCTNLFDKQWDKYVNSTGKRPEDLGGMSGIYPQDGRYIGIGGSIHF